MAPLDVERAVLFGQVPLPGDGARPIQRDDLSGSEPCVDEVAVGHRARRREVVLVVHRREVARRVDPPFPDPRPGRTVERLDDEDRAIRAGTRIDGERAFALRRRVRALHESRVSALAPHTSAEL